MSFATTSDSPVQRLLVFLKDASIVVSLRKPSLNDKYFDLASLEIKQSQHIPMSMYKVCKSVKLSRESQ